MRSYVRVSVAGAALATILILGMGRPASAALMDKQVLNGINDTVATLRYLHRQVADAQSNLDLVHAALDLTQKQYDALKAQYENEAAKGSKERAIFFKNHLMRLEHQLTKLREPNFDKSYGARIADWRTQIAKHSVDLDTRVAEYETLFGKKPNVQIAFETEMAKYRPKRAGAAYFLQLD